MLEESHLSSNTSGGCVSAPTAAQTSLCDAQALRQAARNEAQRKRRALRQAGSATQEVKRLLCEDW